MDLHSRFIVGWALSAVNDRHLTLSALDKALKRRCAEAGLLHHSDQGCTYASEDYRTRLDAHGITCSMSRRGNCYHNAVMESWFSTVKSEEAERFESYAHAKEALFDYIEVFYEPAALTLHARSDQPCGVRASLQCCVGGTVGRSASPCMPPIGALLY